MVSRILPVVVFALAFAAASLAQVTIKVNANSGDVISGEKQFRVIVDSKNLVTQVEFYVGDDLRDSDSSTPYEFRLDTIAEAEGDIEVTFAAYTSEGESAKKVLKLKIDNELGKGPDHFVEKATELMVERKWDEAILQCRIALKAKPGYVPAQLAMARANFGKGVLDSAQRDAEDAVKADPENTEALDLLSAINLQKAFGTVNRGGDRNETLELMKKALIAAAQSRAKVYETRLNKLGQPTDQNRIQVADVAIRGGRFSVAIDAVQSAFRKDERNAALANRLIYAQLRAGRFAAATENALIYQKRGQPDGYGYALIAIVLNRAGEVEKADEALRQAILNDSQGVGVRTAQAYLALVRNRNQEFAKLAASLANDEGHSPEVGCYLMTMLHETNDYEGSRKAFETAVLAEPGLYDLYIQRANQAIAFNYQQNLEEKEAAYQKQVARAFFEAALAAKPESFEAFTGLALLDIDANKIADAAKNARSAILAGPEYAAGHYAASVALSLLARNLRAQQQEAEANRTKSRQAGLLDEEARYAKLASDLKAAADKASRECDAAIAAAGKFDKPNLEGVSVPDMRRAWNYFYRYGRTPLLAPPSSVP